MGEKPWTSRRHAARWPWRDFLTAEEAATLRAADEAKAEWLALNAQRAAITNRAIHRAKYAASKEGGDHG